MLAARVLGRAARSGGSLLASGSRAAESASIPSWSSILEQYGSRTAYNASFATFGDQKSGDKHPKQQQKPFSPLAAQRFMSSGSSSSGVIDTDPGKGGGYMMLSMAHATLASLCFIIPEAMANFFFPGVALPQGFQSQVLVQILGCGVAAGSATCYALKQAADARALNSPTAQRLQLGLVGFSAAAIGTHLMYSPAITLTSLGAGAVVMGTTGAVAYRSYTDAVGKAPKVGEVLSRYFGAIPDHLRINNLPSGLFALLTPVLALAGASYLALPGYSLASVFGYAKDASSFFFWQNVGGGLMTIAPALTYSLKAEADAGNLGDPVAKTLSAGLIVTALGHIAILAPMVMNGQGGPMLPWLLAAWATGAGAGAMGLVGGGSASAGTASGSGHAAAGKM